MSEKIIRRRLTSTQTLITEGHGKLLPNQSGEQQATESECFELEYRPHNWSEVLGQSHVVASLPMLLRRRSKRSFLLSGPSGVGKTSVARLMAKDFCSEGLNYQEINAAMYTGVDKIREIAVWVCYKPWGKGCMRVAFFDECASLSDQAWECLQKLVEEPPRHAVFIFATTKLGKTPEPIQNRCAGFDFRLVKTDLIFALLERVKEDKGLRLEPDAIYHIARRARGVPRHALRDLEQVRDVTTVEQVKAILLSPRKRLR